MHVVKIRRIINSSPMESYTTEDNNDDMEILNGFLNISSKKNNAYDEDKEKKKKKKKRKKKGKKKKDPNKIGNIDIDKLNLFDDEEDKEKEDESDTDKIYEKRFNGSLILLTNLMKEINKVSIGANEFLDKMMKGKVRASPTAIANQTSTVNSLFSTKLSTIKEITAINSKISDLEIKRATAENKDKNKSNDETNNALIIDKMFDKLMMSESKIGPDYDDIDDSDDKILTSKKDKKKKSKSINQRIKELQESGEITFSDSELAFRYEKDNVRIVIYKNVNTGRWKFVAINEDGDELYDYPLPDKKNIGKVKLDMESLIAKDGLGREYQIIPVESFDDSDDYLTENNHYIEDDNDEYSDIYDSGFIED